MMGNLYFDCTSLVGASDIIKNYFLNKLHNKLLENVLPFFGFIMS